MCTYDRLVLHDPNSRGIVPRPQVVVETISRFSCKAIARALFRRRRIMTSNFRTYCYYRYREMPLALLRLLPKKMFLGYPAHARGKTFVRVLGQSHMSLSAKYVETGQVRKRIHDRNLENDNLSFNDIILEIYVTLRYLYFFLI